MTEAVLHAAHGQAVPETATPWLMEPTSNVTRAAFQQIGPLGLGDLIGAYIFLSYPRGRSISFGFELNEFAKTFGRTLMENALIHALAAEGRVTTTPQEISLLWRNTPNLKRTKPSPRQVPQHDPTLAQALLARIQSLSGLTLEEIAPLLGVSRRSLQNWRAKRRISARKEQRLRDLADTFKSLPPVEANKMRRTLLDRILGSVRPYDLLAEGRFDAAYSMITRSAAPAHLVARAAKPTVPPAPSLGDRLSIRNDGLPFPGDRVDLRRSKRLKR